MKPGPSLAAHCIHEYIALDAPPTDTVIILQRIIIKKGWEPINSLAAEMAAKWNAGFIKKLRSIESESNRLGRYCPHTFNSSDDSKVQGPCFIEGTESDEVKLAKTKRLSHAPLMKALQSVDWQTFECICLGILEAMGASDIYVTQGSADNGIDFYGRLPLESELRRSVPLPSAYRRLRPWLVGQAKCYSKSRARTPDLRELAGSVQLAKSDAYPRRNPLSELNIRACDPVFYMFLTTGRISSDGWELAEESGIIALDGDMVAQFLADHNIGWKEDSFDQNCFDEWVSNCKSKAIESFSFGD